MLTDIYGWGGASLLPYATRAAVMTIGAAADGQQLEVVTDRRRGHTTRAARRGEPTLPSPAMDISDLPADRFTEALRLWADAGLTRPWNDAEQDLRRAVEGPASTVLAAVAEGVLVGTVMVGHDGHRGWVYYLAVAEGRRGRGVGRTLMQAAERWVVERGVLKLQLLVRTENQVALGFYARLGYEQGEVVMLGRRLNK